MKRRLNWKAYCLDHGVRLSGNVRRGVWLECVCPFHKDNNPSGAVNLKTNNFSCWSCGRKTAEEFVSQTAGCSTDWRDVNRVLQPYYTDVLPGVFSSTIPQDTQEARQTRVSHKDAKLIMPGKTPLSKAMCAYLERRGFDPEYVTKYYGLKDGGISGPYAYRLMIPVKIDGRTVTWQGRHIGNNKMRYKAADKDIGVNIKDVVYNLDHCRYNKCICVEGVFDCMRIGDDCIATFGISLRNSQINFIASHFDEVYIVFDWEPEAQARARELARKLNNIGCHATVLEIQDTEAEDPGTLSAKEIQELKRTVFADIPDYDYSTPQLLERERSRR